MKKELIFGIVGGLIFAFLVWSGVGFVIGVPSILGLAEQGRFLTIVLLAPVLEEFAFRFILPFLVYKKLTQNWVVMSLLTSVIFSLYHIAVYGSLIDKSALFASAVVFGICSMFVLRILSKSDNPSIYWKYLIATIIMHSLINLAIFIKPMVIV